MRLVPCGSRTTGRIFRCKASTLLLHSGFGEAAGAGARRGALECQCTTRH